MMKKLLIFMLVLGLASAANAVIVGSYTLQVSDVCTGPYSAVVDSELYLYPPSATLWIGVNNGVAGSEVDTQMGQFYLGIKQHIVGYDGEDPIYAADTVWTGNYIDFRPPLVAAAPVPANEYYGIGDVGGGLILSVWALTLTDGNPASRQGVGVLDAKELHCESMPSDDVIYLINMDDGTILDTIVIHQMPEPATIALLGLGGLLLRRRR